MEEWKIEILRQLFTVPSMKPNHANAAVDAAHIHWRRRLPWWLALLHPRRLQFWCMTLPAFFSIVIAVLLFSRWPGEFRYWHETNGGWAYGIVREGFNTPINHNAVIAIGPFSIGRTPHSAPVSFYRTPPTLSSRYLPPPPGLHTKFEKGEICVQYGFKGGIEASTDDCVYFKLIYHQ